MNFTNFFKRNYDLIIPYTILIVAYMVGVIDTASCTGQMFCGLGEVILLMNCFIISIPLIGIAIIRNFKNKKLSKFRWLFILPFALVLIGWFLYANVPLTQQFLWNIFDSVFSIISVNNAIKFAPIFKIILGLFGISIAFLLLKKIYK